MTEKSIIVPDFPDKEDKEEKRERICKACGSVFNEKTIALSLGGLPLIICSDCKTLQIPEEMYDGIVAKVTSNIVPATGSIIR